MVYAKSKEWIQPKTAWKRLKTAQEYPRSLYIYSVTGYGKTALLDHYFEELECERYSCRNGRLTRIHEEDKAKEGENLQPVTDENGRALKAIVIDDLQFLKNAEDRAQIIGWLNDKENWVVLSSRSPLPPWLKLAYMELEMMLISAAELAWTEQNIKTYFEGFRVKLTKEQAKEICDYSQGNVLGIRYIAKLCADCGMYKIEMLEQSWHDYEDYLIVYLMEEWESELVQFLMQMSFMKQFNCALAEMVTGDTAAYRRIKEAEEVGNFIFKDEKDFYELRPLMRTALQRRAKSTYGSDKIKEIYYNAGLYYEVHGEVVNALDMYRQSGNTNRIREILIRNALKNPGNGHYFELRKYYFDMSVEEMEKSPVLMAGMSMLHSLLMQPKESEKWYNRLQKFENAESGAAGREAKARRIYLDIALPHRGSRGVQGVLKSLPLLIERQRISLPEFSVTGNQPSIMNGGKDFCEWSRHDKEIASALGQILRAAFGRYGKGLIDVALAESQYEKGGDDYDVIALLTKGSMSAQAGGVVEIEYAAAGIQARLNLIHGNDEAAADILNGIRKKAEEEQAGELIKNLEAQKCRIALYRSNEMEIEQWLETAPDEEKEFYTLERYRYLTKVRCYIRQGEYLRALALLEKLKIYAVRYERTYIQIEAMLLLSMVQYRTRKEEWRNTLLMAVKCAENYGFYRIISEEGNALWTMMSDKAMKKLLMEACDGQYIKKLLEDTHSMALYFPLYLTLEVGERQEFKGNALEILRLQAEGMTNEQIAASLGLKEETVRYHNKQNYRKLGVEGRAEAVIKARKLRIL